MGWHIITFKTREAQLRWIDRHGHNYQWREVFINNAYGLDVRRLRRIY